jgi:hypothetical protein
MHSETTLQKSANLPRVWLADGSVVETPFWDMIEIDPTSGKITTACLASPQCLRNIGRI